ncbi:LapA family protein [Tomitella fengzijianii]|nr:LapA family protein [Tomitella fengzijianii]
MSERAVSDRSSFLSRLSFTQWIAVVLAILAIIFVLMNRDTTSISFFGVTVSAPLWLTLILVFAVGWLTGVLTMRKRRRGKVE